LVERAYASSLLSASTDSPSDSILPRFPTSLPRSRLIPLYLTYFFFRTRGYVLASGLKLGVDYVAYPLGGAEKWHAQFCILVGDIEYVDADSTLNPHGPMPLNTTDIYIMRTIHTCNKQNKSCLYVRVFCTQSRSDSTPPTSVEMADDHDTTHSISSTQSQSFMKIEPNISNTTIPTPSSPCSPSSPFVPFSLSVVLLSAWFVARGRSAADTATAQTHQPAPRTLSRSATTSVSTSSSSDARESSQPQPQQQAADCSMNATMNVKSTRRGKQSGGNNHTDVKPSTTHGGGGKLNLVAVSTKRKRGRQNAKSQSQTNDTIEQHTQQHMQTQQQQQHEHHQHHGDSSTENKNATSSHDHLDTAQDQGLVKKQRVDGEST